MPTFAHALTRLACPLSLLAAAAGCVDLDDDDVVAGAPDPAAFIGGAPSATISGTGAGVNVAPSPAVLLSASVIHPRLALTAAASLPPTSCVFDGDLTLTLGGGAKAHLAVIDHDFRGTGLALVALDRASPYQPPTHTYAPTLVGQPLTCYGARSRTTVGQASFHVVSAAGASRVTVVNAVFGAVTPSDVGAACYNAGGKLVATMARAATMRTSTMRTFDGDDVSYARAQANTVCGFAL